MAPEGGKSVVSLGVMELLSGRVERLGFFRPVVPREPDPQLELMRARYGAATACALTADEAAGLQPYDELRKRVVESYKQLESGCDFVLCEGTDFTGAAPALDFGLNADLANELGAPVLVVVRGGEPEQTAASVRADVWRPVARRWKQSATGIPNPARCSPTECYTRHGICRSYGQSLRRPGCVAVGGRIQRSFGCFANSADASDAHAAPEPACSAGAGIRGRRREIPRVARRTHRRVRIAVINGPNLNLLGTREPTLYGTDTLADIESRLLKVAKELGAELSFSQHNGEGQIVDDIHGLRGRVDGLLLNAGAYSHTSLAIRDALVGVKIPFVEIHLTNIYAREQERRHSALADAAVAVICGFGAYGYELALRGLVKALPVAVRD